MKHITYNFSEIGTFDYIFKNNKIVNKRIVNIFLSIGFTDVPTTDYVQLSLLDVANEMGLGVDFGMHWHFTYFANNVIDMPVNLICGSNTLIAINAGGTNYRQVTLTISYEDVDGTEFEALKKL